MNSIIFNSGREPVKRPKRVPMFEKLGDIQSVADRDWWNNRYGPTGGRARAEEQDARIAALIPTATVKATLPPVSQGEILTSPKYPGMKFRRTGVKRFVKHNEFVYGCDGDVYQKTKPFEFPAGREILEAIE